MWDVQIDGKSHMVDDLTKAYGNKAIYEETDPVRHHVTGEMLRVIRIIHPFDTSKPFYAIKVK